TAFCKSQYSKDLEEPSIIHFSGKGLKPWQSRVMHPFRDEYYAYRNQTPWKQTVLDRLRVGSRPTRQKIKNSVRDRIISLVNKAYENVFARTLNSSFKIVARSEELVRNLEARKYLETWVQKRQPSLEVMSGPFRGLKYPRLESICSALTPKIIGSYESELHPIMSKILKNNYSTIIDIGCAEGYYAIGLAQKLSATTVHAFDIDLKARKLCEEMSLLNNTTDRVIVKEFFTLKALSEIECHERGLIISDCEGCETDIFNPNSSEWEHLRKYDILIEVHEFIKPGASNYIYNLFRGTHEITIVQSIDDLLKPSKFETPFDSDITLSMKRALMAEHRPFGMEWFFMQPN
ncbi:MAG: hypothetical protein AAFR59_05130, partial [Bacteroidota bacterium]